MTVLLTDQQRNLLRSEPLGDRANRLRRAVKLADTSTAAVADRLHIPYQQLNRYAAGGDLLLSTAWRIAEAFGLNPCDLWPVPPVAQRNAHRVPKGKRSAPVKVKQSRTPKAKAA